MPLKNYTSEVPAMRSIGQIQENLIAHGAISIMTNIGPDRKTESISFIIPTKHGDIPFRLPANVKKVEAILLGRRARKPEKVMKRIGEQASRTAWRIIKDWVDAQLAIIETEMVTIEQVFLPYMMIDNKTTLYDKMLDKGFLLLNEGRGE
jgi:hypothetical protein